MFYDAEIEVVPDVSAPVAVGRRQPGDHVVFEVEPDGFDPAGIPGAVLAGPVAQRTKHRVGGASGRGRRSAASDGRWCARLGFGLRDRLSASRCREFDILLLLPFHAVIAGEGLMDRRLLQRQVTIADGLLHAHDFPPGFELRAYTDRNCARNSRWLLLPART